LLADNAISDIKISIEMQKSSCAQFTWGFFDYLFRSEEQSISFVDICAAPVLK
jgi:hypothetical protein